MTTIHFGTDGWRGVIAEDFTFSAVRLVAAAIALTVKDEHPEQSQPQLLVGHDTRFLSPEFARAAAEAMARHGLAVSLTSAYAPTPAFSYAVVHRGAAGAVVVTASHNPPVYNGIKFKSSYGGSAPIAFTSKVEERIQRLEADGGSSVAARPSPPIEAFDAREPWLDRLETLVDLRSIGAGGVNAALDVMYGAGQGMLSGRLRRAGCQVRELHAELNPGFGGLHPEPIPANLRPLIDLMTTWAASPRVGFAFDGDSDRLAPVDETGRVLTPHETLALLVRHLTRNRGWRGTIVKSLNIGRMVDREAAALGLPVVTTPVGFKHIAEAMLSHDAIVGGEESGGFAVRGHIPERDPALIALLLMEYVAAAKKSLGALLREMEAEHGPHRYDRLDLRLPSLAARDEVVDGLMRHPPDQIRGSHVVSVNALDGIKLTLNDEAWVMLRASGTEPLLRIYAEAATESKVQGLLAWGREVAEGRARTAQHPETKDEKAKPRSPGEPR